MSTIKGFKIFAVTAIILLWLSCIFSIVRPQDAATAALNEASKTMLMSLPFALLFGLNRVMRDIRAIQIMFTTICMAAIDQQNKETA